MANFAYKALDSNGKTIKGFIEGDYVKSVRIVLRAQGLLPIEVREINESNKQKSRTSRLKLKTTDLCVFTRQMATLLNSGLTIEEALSAINRQAKNMKLLSLVSDLHTLIVEGFSFSEALKSYPKTFIDIYISSVKAGEQSGNLSVVMLRLSEYFENKQLMQQKISTALVYPIFLLLASISIVIGLVVYVIPKVVTVFETSDAELPTLTSVLITTSEFLQNYGVFLIVFIVTMGLLLKMVFSETKPRYWLHEQILKIIGVGGFIQSVETARMARTLSILVSSGVPLITSMKSTVGVFKNNALKQDFTCAIDEVAQGVSISRALGRGGKFPPLMIQMVASGENNSELDTMLEYVAESIDREVQARVSMFISLFEPIMLLVMGVIVLTIVMAILLPIFDLNQVLS